MKRLYLYFILFFCCGIETFAQTATYTTPSPIITNVSATTTTASYTASATGVSGLTVGNTVVITGLTHTALNCASGCTVASVNTSTKIFTVTGTYTAISSVADNGYADYGFLVPSSVINLSSLSVKAAGGGGGGGGCYNCGSDGENGTSGSNGYPSLILYNGTPLVEAKGGCAGDGGDGLDGGDGEPGAAGATGGCQGSTVVSTGNSSANSCGGTAGSGGGGDTGDDSGGSGVVGNCITGSVSVTSSVLLAIRVGFMGVGGGSPSGSGGNGGNGSISFSYSYAPNAPTYSPIAGTYSSATTVTITSTTSGASIYYTLDGSTPTTSSTLYSSPITISSTDVLNSIASLSGVSSSVTTGNYVIGALPTVINSAANTIPSDYATALAFPSNNTAGNAAFVILVINNLVSSSAFLNTPFDTNSNVYTACETKVPTSYSGYNTYFYLASSIKGGSNIVNVWADGTAREVGIIIGEVANLPNPSCDIFSTATTTTSSTISVTTPTLNHVNELVISWGGFYAGGIVTTYSAGTGFTLGSQVSIISSLDMVDEFIAPVSTNPVICSLGSNNPGFKSENCISLYSTKVVATPTLSVNTGIYTSNQIVNITDSTAGATTNYCYNATTQCSNFTAGTSYTVTAPGYVCANATLSGYTTSTTVCNHITVPAVPAFTVQPTKVWVSPSSIAASFQVNVPSSVVGKCGTTSGGPYTLEATPPLYVQGWQRTDFTGTSTNWGHAVAITGMQKNVTVYCVIVATDASGLNSVISNEFSGTTLATVSTIPVTVNAISKLTRVNDQYQGFNGMPNNGFFINGDTEQVTQSNDGGYYGTCHDCQGVHYNYSNVIALLKWTDSSHTIATQYQYGNNGILGFGQGGVATTGGGWTIDQGTWESWGIQSIRGNIYLPIRRCWPDSTLATCGDFNILRSPDYLVHTINAGNQYSQGTGQYAQLAVGADVPIAPTIAPGNPIPGSVNSTGTVFAFDPYSGGVISTCQDESINCYPIGNNDGYIYSWGFTNPSNYILTRIRVENFPAMYVANWQVYTCTNVDDDGVYDSCWSNDPTQARQFGPNTGFNLGSLPNSQFIPDFNRYLFLNTLDNTNGGSVVIYDCGPYPWGIQTPIGSIDWDADTWTGYTPSFGQILPGSYLKTNSFPLSALLMVTTTGTVSGSASSPVGSGPGPEQNAATSYSPFIGKVNLTPRVAIPPKSKVSSINSQYTFVANGLDLYYDFRNTSTVIVNYTLPNLSPNDLNQVYSVPSSKLGVVNTGSGTYQGAYYSPKGIYSFGYYGANSSLSTSYTKALTSFSALIAFEAHNSGSNYSGVFNKGANFQLERNGTTANSWQFVLNGITVGPFSLTTDNITSCVTPPTCTPNYVALLIDWDGTIVNIYSSTQIPKIGYSFPLTPLATGTVSGGSTDTSTLRIGSGTTSQFQGTISNFLFYPRHTTDPEKVQNMTALRNDMLSRGITLP